MGIAYTKRVQQSVWCDETLLMLMLIGSNKDRNRDRGLGRQERFRRGKGKNMVIDGRVTRSSVAQAQAGK